MHATLINFNEVMEDQQSSLNDNESRISPLARLSDKSLTKRSEIKPKKMKIFVQELSKSNSR